MYNTPPCWCIYMTGLVLKYLENDIGGLANMQKINEAKAKGPVRLPRWSGLLQ